MVSLLETVQWRTMAFVLMEEFFILYEADSLDLSIELPPHGQDLLIPFYKKAADN